MFRAARAPCTASNMRTACVKVGNERCLHGSCKKKRPMFNVKDRLAAYCENHAGDGTVDVGASRCSGGVRSNRLMVSGSPSMLRGARLLSTNCKQHAPPTARCMPAARKGARDYCCLFSIRRSGTNILDNHRDRYVRYKVRSLLCSQEI